MVVIICLNVTNARESAMIKIIIKSFQQQHQQIFAIRVGLKVVITAKYGDDVND